VEEAPTKPSHAAHDKPSHDHSSHEASTTAMKMAARVQAKQAEMDRAAMGHGPMDQATMNHGAMGMSDESMAMQRHDHPGGPGVVNEAVAPTKRLGERGLGLENEPHRVLVYTDLVSLAPNPDQRAPAREVELHLTSNMERYMWSFDGVKFSEVKGPIIFQEGERLRLTMVNDTMMAHPIHLHGMFFDVVTGGDNAYKPRKHTIVAKPGEKLSVDITADALGEWAFHCHLLYHMRAGMMRVVSVREGMTHKEMKPEKVEHDHHEHMHHGDEVL
jgi:FtsP/CotA-like multicopper oxidase with cupredoxin domain